VILELQIFWVFFRISVMSFGGVFGVLPELERVIVGEYGWIDHDRFVQSYVVGQFVPGPNMAMCPLIGYWVAGWTGWIAGFLGIYGPPMVVVGAAFKLYTKYRSLEWVRRTELALRPLVFGLIGSSSLFFFWNQSRGDGLLNPVYSRIFAVVMCAVGAWLYSRKKAGPMTLIFTLGGIWWAFHQIPQLLH
jgi:chromate transporter